MENTRDILLRLLGRFIVWGNRSGMVGFEAKGDEPNCLQGHMMCVGRFDVEADINILDTKAWKLVRKAVSETEGKTDGYCVYVGGYNDTHTPAENRRIIERAIEMCEASNG